MQLCFGLYPLYVHLATAGFAPRAIVTWRIGAGALALGAIALARHGRAALPRRADLPRTAACALLGVVVNQSLATEGIARTTATSAGLLMALIPVFTYALATAVRQERFEARRALGIALALGGASLLVLGRVGPEERALGGRFGNALVATNCLSYATFLVLARPLLARVPPLALTAQVYALAALALPLVALGVDPTPPAPPTSAVLALAAAIAFPTVLAYLLNTVALARVRASTTAVYVLLQPLVAGAAGVLVLGERPGPELAAAAALIFGGIALTARRAPPRGLPAAAE